MAEKWIYQVRMNEAGTLWKKIGEEGDPYYEVARRAVFDSGSPLLEKYKKWWPYHRFIDTPEFNEWTFRILEELSSSGEYQDVAQAISDPGMEDWQVINIVDEQISHHDVGTDEMLESMYREWTQSLSGHQEAACQTFQHFFKKGWIRWAVEESGADLGSEYDTMGSISAFTDWQILYKVRGKVRWINAYLTRSYTLPSGVQIPSIIEFLKRYGIKIDPSKVYTEGSRAAEELLERGLRKFTYVKELNVTSPILRRRIPANVGDIETVTDTCDLVSLVEAQKPYHELLDDAITGLQYNTYVKLLGAIWGVNDYGHLQVTAQGGKINYAGSSYPISVFNEWLKTNGSNSFFVGNTRFTPPSSTRPFSFMSVGELEKLKVDLTDLFDVDSDFLRNLPLEERLGLGWRKVVYHKVLEAIDAELGRKATEQDKFPPDLGWALWRDVVFADRAWEGYEELVDKRSPFLAAGLSDAELEAIWRYYLDLVPREKFSSTVLVNDSLLRLGRFVELPPHKGGDMPGREKWGYDYRKDVLEHYIWTILNTNQLRQETPITPEFGPSGEYRGFPSIYDQQHPPQSHLSPQNEQQAGASITSVGGGTGGGAALLSLAMYGALPEQDTTQVELPPSTTASGGRTASSSSLSLPSFPSMNLSSISGGPSALPSPVGLGGVVDEVPSAPSVGLPSMGWDGAAMPAPPVGLTGIGGGSAPTLPSPGSFGGGLTGAGSIGGGSAPSLPGASSLGGGMGGGLAVGGLGGGFDLGGLGAGASAASAMPASMSGAGNVEQSLSRAESIVDRLMQVPDQLDNTFSSVSPLAQGGPLSGDFGQQQIQQPQIVHRFEKGAVQIHTKKMSPQKIFSMFLARLREQSRQGEVVA